MESSSRGRERASAFLEPSDAAWIDAFSKSLGLKRLNPSWAKLEIVIGLTVGVIGFKILATEGSYPWAGALLSVLGLYLAMAGNRSHLYQSMNQRTAHLLQMLERASRAPQADE